MRNRVWLAALALLLIAGCRDRTYVMPTERYSPESGPKIEQIKPELFAGVNALAARLPKDKVHSPVAAYQTLAVLFNGAEGKTYDALADLLSAKDLERFDVNDAQQAWRMAYCEQNGPVMVESGIWMIWPVLVTPQFQKEMAKVYRADVLKLGSAGLGAANAVNAWAKSRSKGSIPTVVDDLDIDDQIITTSLVSVQAGWSAESGRDGVILLREGLQAGEISGVTVWQVLPADSPLIMLVAAPGERTIDLLPLLTGTAELKDRNATLVLPAMDRTITTDLAPAIKAAGGRILIDGPNDLRNISIEFDRQGRIDKMWQVIRLSWSAGGLGVPAPKDEETSIPADAIRLDGPLQIVIADRKTRSAIIVGRINPAR